MKYLFTAVLTALVTYYVAGRVERIKLALRYLRKGSPVG